MKFILFLFIFLIPFGVKADNPRHKNTFTSPNGEFELRKIWGGINQKWELIDKSSGKARYQLLGDYLSSMTIFVSDDGRNVVAIDDFSEREATEDLDVLLFYDEGKLIKKYTLGELLNDTENIERSVSHFRWFFFPNKLRIEASKLTLKTFELFNYTFDIKTGEILKKERDPILTDDSLYIYGMLKNLGNSRYEIEVCHVVQGTIPKKGKVQFEVLENTKFFMNNVTTVIIRKGELVAQNGLILNSCNYRRARRNNN